MRTEEDLLNELARLEQLVSVVESRTHAVRSLLLPYRMARVWAQLPWDTFDGSYVRVHIGYAALPDAEGREQIMEYVPERFHAAVRLGFADRDEEAKGVCDE